MRRLDVNYLRQASKEGDIELRDDSVSDVFAKGIVVAELNEAECN